MDAATRTYINRNLINIKDSDFKYTLSPIRRRWVKSIYPIMEEIIKIPQAIPWKTYEFRGKIPLWIPKDSENNSYEQNSDIQYNISDEEIIAKYPDGAVPYEFFGGSVYELLHNQFYKERVLNVDVPHIRAFLDPTGDVDVHIARPKISYTYDVDPTDSDYTDKTLTIINPLIDDWSHWLFEEVIRAIATSPIPAYFEPISEKMTKSETAMAIESKYVGNILITRVKILDMIKVQCSIKLKDSTIEDHFLEFLYNLNEGGEDTIKYKDYRTSLHLNNDVYVQPLKSLYKENYDSISNRLVFINNPEFQHKFYNHIQRLSYLNRIVPLMIPKFKSYVQNLTDEITNLCYILRILSVPENYPQLGLVRNYEKNFQEVIDKIRPAVEADPAILCKFVYTEKEKEKHCNYKQKLENIRTIIGDILQNDVLDILLNYKNHPRRKNVEGIRKFIYSDVPDIWSDFPATDLAVAKPVAVANKHLGGYRKTQRRQRRQRRQQRKRIITHRRHRK